MKTVENWISSVENKFGATATKFGAWKRVCQHLHKERGRIDVLRVMKDKDQLHGKGNAGGIEECRQVVTEMERMKAGKVPGPLPPPPAEADTGVPPPEDADAAPSSEEAAEVVVDEELLMEDVQDTEPEDPSWAKARALVDAELTHIVVHDDPRAWREDLQARVFSESRAAVIIDAVTIKTQVDPASAAMGMKK